MSRPAPVRAAGGVVLRRAPGGGSEVLLVHRPHHEDWTLPKGKVDRGETGEDCALREVAEETGLRCVLGAELSSVRYRDARGRDKVVRYWVMTVTAGRFRKNREVDRVLWLPLAEARRRLTYAGDRAVVRAAPARVRRLVFLVRHARAGVRARWRGDDRRRPLDALGRRQAEALATRLAGYPVAGLYASPYDRCVQTLEPLGHRLGLPVKTRGHLAEGQGRDDLLRLLRAIDAGPVALCTHGDVVTALVGEDAPHKKGATWVLRRAGAGLRAVRYWPPSR